MLIPSLINHFCLWVTPQTTKLSSKYCCSPKVSFIEWPFLDLDFKSWGYVLPRASDHYVWTGTSLEGEGWVEAGKELALQALPRHTWRVRAGLLSAHGDPLLFFPLIVSFLTSVWVSPSPVCFFCHYFPLVLLFELHLCLPVTLYVAKRHSGIAG